jgi:hypothetical protein
MWTKRRLKTLLLVFSAIWFAFFAFLDLLSGQPISLGYLQIVGMSLTGLVFIFALRPEWLRQFVKVSLYIVVRFSWIVAVLAGLLMLINLIGLPISIRNPDMYTVPVRYGGKERLALYTPGEVYQQMYQRPDEDRKAYLVRLNNLIFDGTIHYWEEEGLITYNLQVPIYENFILFFDHFGEVYLFCDGRRAVERGASICTQSTVILMSILNEQGITAKQYALEGHTVALVEVAPASDEWWFADADFGVVVPKDYREVEKDSESILPLYRDAGYAGESFLLEALVNAYGSEGNHSQGTIQNFKYCERETLAYQLKWLLPGAGLLQLPLVIIPAGWLNRKSYFG